MNSNGTLGKIQDLHRPSLSHGMNPHGGNSPARREGRLKTFSDRLALLHLMHQREITGRVGGA